MYYTETEARKMVIEAGRRLLEDKLVARTWGNISARISDDSFVITPSGKAYESLTENDLVVVNTDGSYEGGIKPSSERGVHADAYALRSDVSFIVHTHQYYASAVAAECKGKHFAPCAAYGLPGTYKLRKNMKACIAAHPDTDTFLMARHGALILAGGPDEAFALADGLEEKCRALVEARVPSYDAVEHADFDTSKIDIRAMPYVKIADDPFVMECCKAGMKVGAYIDDFAQIIGPDIQVVENDEWAAERALLGYSTGRTARNFSGKIPMTGALDRMGGQQPTLNSAIGRNAVLVKGTGAVCVGKTESDAVAAAEICSKNCAAACYVRRAKPMSALDARLQRYIYLTKYSGLNDDYEEAQNDGRNKR